MIARSRALATVLIATFGLVVPVGATGSADAAPVARAGGGWAVNSTCAGAQGSLSLRQVPVGHGDARVTVVGHGLHDGRWTGEYDVRVDRASSAVMLIHARVQDGTFRTRMRVPARSTSSTVSLTQRKRSCLVGASVHAASAELRGTRSRVNVRMPEPHTIAARSLVRGCAPGTAWTQSVSVTFAGGGMGAGDGDYRCRDHRVELPRTAMSTDDLDGVLPQGMTFRFRGSDGDVRRISYSALAAS